MTESDIATEVYFHPGEYITDELAERGWSQVDLCALSGLTPKHVNQIIKGKAGIGPVAALGLAEAFGTSAEMWMALSARWEIAKERGRRRGEKVPTTHSLQGPGRHLAVRKGPNEDQRLRRGTDGRNRVGDQDGDR